MQNNGTDIGMWYHIQWRDYNNRKRYKRAIKGKGVGIASPQRRARRMNSSVCVTNNSLCLALNWLHSLLPAFNSIIFAANNKLNYRHNYCFVLTFVSIAVSLTHFVSLTLWQCFPSLILLTKIDINFRAPEKGSNPLSDQCDQRLKRLLLFIRI